MATNTSVGGTAGSSSPRSRNAMMEDDVVLSPEQVQQFVQNGVLVVDDVLTPEQLAAARKGLFEQTLRQQFGVDVNDLAATGQGLRQASSTQGSGGVLDVFYPEWKIQVATNQRLFQWTRQLWQAAYKHHGERRDELSSDEQFQWHPYGAFDCEKGYAFLDRIGVRLPTELSELLGAAQKAGDDQVNENDASLPSKSKKKKKRALPLQRCLTPHLDCCPDTVWDTSNKQKWRPIQCLVSLSDTLQADHGGFEAVVSGFHRTFDQWATERRKNQVENAATGKARPLCFGEYTHIRPVEDREVLRQIQHVPVQAGGAIFWDVRVPHGNAFRHLGTEPRCVVYCSFLPDVALNRKYVARQLQQWKEGRPPMDQVWSKTKTTNGDKRRKDESHSEIDDGSNEEETKRPPSHEPLTQEQIDRMTPLTRRLFGIDPW